MLKLEPSRLSAGNDGVEDTVYAVISHSGPTQVFIVKNAHEKMWNVKPQVSAAASQHEHDRTLEGLVALITCFSFGFLACMSAFLSTPAAISMLLVMVIGTYGNVLIAARPPASWAHGVTLKTVEVIHDDSNAMTVLQDLETRYPGYGEPPIEKIFRHGLPESAKLWWTDLKEKREQQQNGKNSATGNVAEEKEETLNDNDEWILAEK